MWIKNIKEQTLLLLVSLTLGVALAFSILAVIAAFVIEDAVISNFLDEQASHIEKQYAQQGNVPPLAFSFLEVFESVGAMPTWVQDNINPDRIDGEIFTSDASHYHYRKLTLSEGREGYLLAEVSRLLVVTHQPRILVIFLLVFVVAMAVAVFLAVKFSQKIVNPILALTDAVKHIEQPATSARLPELDFELGYLSKAMQTSFDKLNKVLEQEKAFTTNVSHELRTPLTVLKNSCVLIEQRGFVLEDLAQIKSSAVQMEHIVNVLFALARKETIAQQPCNIIIMLEQAILLCRAPQLEHFQIHFDVPQDLTLLANSNLLQLLFINLFRNAAEHASEPSISISYENGKLMFDNKTEYLPEVDITQAGIKGDKSDGIGQGLYLVSRIAEHFNWHVTVETSTQHFRVIIKFA